MAIQDAPKDQLSNSQPISAATFADIPEFGVAHSTDVEAMTGCTIFVARGDCKEGVTCGVDVRGGGPATRETDLLRPENMVQKVNAVMIGGGSAYGLEASCGAMEALADAGFGFELAGAHVPIIPAACLFDLLIGQPKWPDKAMGAAAAKAALAFDAASGDSIEQGSVGAGTGATTNKAGRIEDIVKSGFGYSGLKFKNLAVVSCVAVNALGSVVENAHGNKALELAATAMQAASNAKEQQAAPCTNTTLGVVLTNATLSKAQATKVSQMSQDAYARAIVPVHTSNDGDAIFTMASGKVAAGVDVVGALACATMEEAIRSATRHANA